MGRLHRGRPGGVRPQRLRPLPPPALFALVALIAGAAFLLRIAVHRGRLPGGVDTWYYLAYAAAFRRKPAFRVRLDRYLLQDATQSYPPLFPMLLGLLPPAFLERRFWLASPAIDCVHLLFLAAWAWTLTASAPVVLWGAALFALTPQLVAETRSLNGRSLGALLHSLAVVSVLAASGSGSRVTFLAAVGFGACVWLASASGTASYGVVCAALAVRSRSPLPVVLLGLGGALALAASRGHLVAVLRNYVHALRYWARHRERFGRHPLFGSGFYARPGTARVKGPGFLAGGVPAQALRIAFENPFALLLLLAVVGGLVSRDALALWATLLIALAYAGTLAPPLRVLGPAAGYLRAAAFPTSLALATALVSGRLPLVPGLLSATVAVAALAFFYVYVRRQVTEHTAETDPHVREAARRLRTLPGDSVACLPFMYSDFVAHESGRRVLWGGHCGNLTQFSQVAPVVTSPIETLLAEHRVSHLLLDTRYCTLADLGWPASCVIASSGPVTLCAPPARDPSL